MRPPRRRGARSLFCTSKPPFARAPPARRHALGDCLVCWLNKVSSSSPARGCANSMHSRGGVRGPTKGPRQRAPPATLQTTTLGRTQRHQHVRLHLHMKHSRGDACARVATGSPAPLLSQRLTHRRQFSANSIPLQHFVNLHVITGAWIGVGRCTLQPSGRCGRWGGAAWRARPVGSVCLGTKAKSL